MSCVLCGQAADLRSHDSLRGNPKAMSTVTGIIDGTGSIGAALQVLIAVYSALNAVSDGVRAYLRARA
jgi:hypothetical protein